MMTNILFVFLGGGLGSIARYVIGQYLNTNNGFPLGTMAANILACFVLGVLISMQSKTALSSNQALLLATGFCGGFSTFSTFSAESMKMFQNNQAGLALFYIGISILVGLLAVYLGFKSYS